MLKTRLTTVRQLEQTVSTPYGVLDIHFSPHGQLLAVTTSTGCLALYSCLQSQSESAQTDLHHVRTYQLFEKSVVVTSIAWDTQGDRSLYISASNGKVIKFNISSLSTQDTPFQTLSSEPVLPGSMLTEYEGSRDEELVYQHELEAWTVVCTPQTWKNHQVFSGGDDAAIIGPGLHNNRIHQAGVTAILPLSEGIIATGSYDDHLRIIKLPDGNNRRPEILHEINLEGGVWRLKPLEELPQKATEKFVVRILVSCMYAGAFVVNLNGGPNGEDWSVAVAAHFLEHESMNYGSDVQPGGLENVRTIASCSFYDKRLCLWRLES